MTQIWKYDGYMDFYNPICIDAGEITAIHSLNDDNCIPEQILADGLWHGIFTKQIFLELGSWCSFGIGPLADDTEIKVKIMSNPKDGDEISINPKEQLRVEKDDIGEDKSWWWYSICVDPRVLYIAFRGYELGWHPSKKEREK